MKKSRLIEIICEEYEFILNEEKYDLQFGHLGNGITVWNKAKEENGDYQKVAHIDRKRKITYNIKNLPSNIKKQVEKIAKGNYNVSATQSTKVFDESEVNEIDFKNQDAFDTYNAKHKMRPTTKVRIAGQDTTAGDASSDKKSSKEKDDWSSLSKSQMKSQRIKNSQKVFDDYIENLPSISRYGGADIEDDGSIRVYDDGMDVNIKQTGKDSFIVSGYYEDDEDEHDLKPKKITGKDIDKYMQNIMLKIEPDKEKWELKGGNNSQKEPEKSDKSPLKMNQSDFVNQIKQSGDSFKAYKDYFSKMEKAGNAYAGFYDRSDAKFKSLKTDKFKIEDIISPSALDALNSVSKENTKADDIDLTGYTPKELKQMAYLINWKRREVKDDIENYFGYELDKKYGKNNKQELLLKKKIQDKLSGKSEEPSKASK